MTPDERRRIVTIEDQLKEVTTAVVETQKRLSEIAKTDPVREALKASLTDALKQQVELRARVKIENTLRNFSGLQSPLADAVRARLDPALVAELEADAVARQQEKDRIAAARRAAKEAPRAAAAPPPAVAPAAPGRMTGASRGTAGPRRQNPATVETIVRRPHASGGVR
jgi:dihydroorotase-like cyclic amidohydrolase